jgi:hypothetical protein
VLLHAVEDGRLPGQLVQGGDRQQVVLAEDVAATIDVMWPPVGE